MARLADVRYSEMGDHIGELVENYLNESKEFLTFTQKIAYGQQEKLASSGYLHGLSRDDIQEPGRLIVVADVYDALIFTRLYKPAFRHEKVVGIMVEARGRDFDPDILDVFTGMQEEFRTIAARFIGSEEVQGMSSL